VQVYNVNNCAVVDADHIRAAWNWCRERHDWLPDNPCMAVNLNTQTPRLRAAVDGALRHSYGGATPIGDARLLLNNHGQRITVSAWNSALQRLRPEMDRLGFDRFTLHDLKAKGYSEQRVQEAGHRSERMHRVYNRKPRLVEPPE